MAADARHTRTRTPRDPWSTAPVVVGHHRRRLGWVLVVPVLIAAVAVAVVLTRPGPPAIAPVTPVAPAPTAAPESPSVPFDVTVQVTDVATMDNDRLFGRDAATSDRAADVAARDIAAVLRAYLDAQFIAPDTRFSREPLTGLLTGPALQVLSEDDLPGLGALGLTVRRVEGEPVMATARVLTEGSDAVLVEVRYDAHAVVIGDDGAPVQMRQRATMVFTSADGAWRAEAVAAELDLPLAPGRVAP